MQISSLSYDVSKKEIMWILKQNDELTGLRNSLNKYLLNPFNVPGIVLEWDAKQIKACLVKERDNKQIYYHVQMNKTKFKRITKIEGYNF